MSAQDEVWILGINMTKFGKHPERDIVDLGVEAIQAALKDAGVTMADIGVLAAGNLMGRGGVGTDAAEASGANRDPGLQRRQCLRDRGDGTSYRSDGHKSRGMRLRIGRWG